MDIKALILKQLQLKKELKTMEIVNKTGLSRTYVNHFFKELQNEGKIILVGRANKVKYLLADKKIFDLYTDTNDSFEFNKTDITVKLYNIETSHISRSQAKRILVGLEKFKIIILDFKGVEDIGQAFADEIFRVWQNNHREIKILPQNTNENVMFMIKRAIANTN